MLHHNDLIQKLKDSDLEHFQVFAGFDASEDCITRPIKKSESERVDVYSCIEEFGKAITQKKAMSGIISLKHDFIKAGGNMINFACALGTMGIQTECFGPFGWPEIDPVFGKLSESCVLHSIGNTVVCTVLEFSDGKLMLADNSGYDDISWNNIQRLKADIGIEQAIKKCDMVALANWGEIKNANDIWKGVLDIIETLQDNKKVCIDITDFSYRSETDVQKLSELLIQYCKKTSCILSFNYNEASMLFNRMGGSAEHSESIDRIGTWLFDYYKPFMLVIHNAKGATAWSGTEKVKSDSYYTTNTKIKAGAGDNFNAGLCVGVLCGMTLLECLEMGNAMSGYYVRNGSCPDKKKLCDFIENPGDL